jgi:hypothetical protein
MKLVTTSVTGIALAALLAVAMPAGADKLKLQKDGKTVELNAQAPSYGPPPTGHIYGGPYPAPYPYYPYGWPPPYMYAPPAGGNRAPPAPGNSTAGQEQIPVGQIIILTDPVSAEVFLDGLRLTRRDDLSYAVGLLEGRHKVKVQAMGYVAYDKTIDVLGGRGMFLTIRLTPLAETPAAR